MRGSGNSWCASRGRSGEVSFYLQTRERAFPVQTATCHLGRSVEVGPKEPPSRYKPPLDPIAALAPVTLPKGQYLGILVSNAVDYNQLVKVTQQWNAACKKEP